MVEKATVLKLLDAIERRLERLQERSATSLDVYLADPDLQAVVERNFEIAIQAAVDLGAHTLAGLEDLRTYVAQMTARFVEERVLP